MLDRKWKRMNGDPVEDLKTEIFKDLQPGITPVLNIGTDSQKHERYHEFVTCAVVVNPGKGGKIFWTTEREKKKFSLREKLFKEAFMSIQLGLELSPYIPEDWEILIHLDANPNTKFKSATYVKQLVGMVVGQGFKSVVKPASWCASHVSEHLVKHKHER